MKILSFMVAAVLSLTSALAQTDSAGKGSIYERVTSELASFKPDTSAVANDKITRKIRELRTLSGGFNVNSVIEFKMQEDEHKNELSSAALAHLKQEFENGRGKMWLDNA